jgi:peroxiredoxin Q/BCP
LSDPDKKVMAEYGAFGEKKMYGKSFLGVIRSTFIISPDGKIKKEWRKVKARGHVDQVLQFLDT